MRSFIIKCLLLLVVACGSKPEKPKGLISKTQMVSILIDAKMISSANGANKKILEANGVFPNSYIFNKYNIDSIQFAQSNEYYTYKLKEYEEIYEMVKDSLDKLKAEYKEIRDKEIEEAEKKSKDSLDAVLRKRDSLKVIESKDSIDVVKPKDSLLLKELNELEIDDDELNLIEPVSDK